MKKIALVLLAGLVTLFGQVPVAHASVNDFSFSSFEADYYLSADSEGRSTLKTVEKLTAEFPHFNQNHGIERAIPTKYDGHSTSLSMVSITDASGKAIAYSTYDSNDNKVFRIGDADTYVQGQQTYVLTYTQRDVTKAFGDNNQNEFYWDTNGTQWGQSFGSVTARVHVDSKLLPTLTSNKACYFGPEGSNKRCDITRSGDVLTARVENLAAGENMTVAIGFTLGTFGSYKPSLADILAGIWVATIFVSSIVGFVLIFWVSYRYSRLSNRTRELAPIPAEYVPPKGTSILVASQIGDGTKADTTAQLIDLAVRHYITITQISEKSLWKQAEYELEIVKSAQDLKDEEKTFIQTLFGDTAIGTKLATKTLKNNYTVAASLRKNTTELTKRIKGDLELRHKDEAASRSLKRPGLIIIAVSVVLLSPLLLIAGLIALLSGYGIRPLTDKGLELRRYLAGFKEYIELAEKDRLKVLQSPEGAAKTGISISGEGDKKLIKLYERTLPYAVLFGQEKEWNKQLALYYENTGSTPDWYVGHSAFNAAVFTSAMNDFSGSMNSYGASSSSSSGGSTGGGSSGGGGGGGGGGGW